MSVPGRPGGLAWLLPLALAAGAFTLGSARAGDGYYHQPHYGQGHGGMTAYARGNGIPVGYGLVPPGAGEAYEPRCKAYRQAVWVDQYRWAYQRIRYCK